MTIGEVIELLIRVKDENSLYRQQVEAINYACNILAHNFGYMEDCDRIIKDDEL